ncbi:Galactosyltransferase 13 protein, partial [Thalictrum thalictroides]
MEIYNGGLFRKKFWSVITALLLFLLVILHTDFSNSITSNKTVIQSSSEDYVHSTLGIYQHPDEYGERVTQSPKVDNEEESIRNISVSVNRNESVSDLPGNENGLQTVEETEAVHQVNRVESAAQATYGAETYSDELQSVADPCLGKYIYVHNLPSKFNNDLLKDCRALCNWMDMCLALSNGGLGQEID